MTIPSKKKIVHQKLKKETDKQQTKNKKTKHKKKKEKILKKKYLYVNDSNTHQNQNTPNVLTTNNSKNDKISYKNVKKERNKTIFTIALVDCGEYPLKHKQNQ